MAINLAEILKVLEIIEGLTDKIEDAYGSIKGHAEEIQDAKTRERLLDACARHDASAVRHILFD